MHREDNRNRDNNEGDTLVADRAPLSGPSAFDAEEYLPHVAEFDLTEEQASEMLATLWEIMRAFVEMGFGVDSIHEFLPALKEVSQEIEAGAVESKSNRISAEFQESAQARGDLLVDREEES